MEIKQVSIEDLNPAAYNPRKLTEKQFSDIKASLEKFGFVDPVIVNHDNTIVGGHQRVKVWQKMGNKTVPVFYVDLDKNEERELNVRLNKNSGEWDFDILANEFEIEELTGWGFEPWEIGFIDASNELSKSESKGNLSDRFLIPPFTVFNAREGWWQNRKRMWLSLGIKSEEGRDAVAYTGQDGLNKIRSSAPGGSNMVASYKNGKRQVGLVSENGTSIFDPVLCEIAYRWFCPVDGLVLDPFAGGSVRGIVAAKLGRQYIGQELRKEQVEANKQQALDICGNDEIVPTWIVGDSRNITNTCADVEADFVFSCPPYADLEVYSDDPADISTLSYENFRLAYFEIIAKTSKLLKENSFACFVVGEIRNKKGFYCNFISDTINAFLEAGLQFYNEAILVTAIRSLPIRAGKQFNASRKLGKTHQNILVFVKGDPKKATQKCGVVDVSDYLEALNDDSAE